MNVFSCMEHRWIFWRRGTPAHHIPELFRLKWIFCNLSVVQWRVSEVPFMLGVVVSEAVDEQPNDPVLDQL